MSDLSNMTREELYQEVLRLRSRLDVTDDMVERAAPVVAFRTPEAWAKENDQFKSYYRKQAREFLTSALPPHPSSKLGDATQKTGQSAENAEGAGSSPVGPVSMWATVVLDAQTGEPVWRCNEADNRDGEHDEPVIELNPATFRFGTKVEVIEPLGEIDRILSLPDAEILEEVQARGEDPVAIADHYRAMVGAIAKKAGGLS